MEQYNEEELSNAILNAIKFNPKTTNELQFIFTGKYEKRHINNCLYNLQKKGKVISTTSDHSSRPIWTSCVNNNDNKISSKAQKHEYECTITIVFIDLGNVHDSLQICEEFVKRGMISKVYAFADYHFNGYGINPSVNDPTNRVKVLKVTDINKNAADILMVWTCKDICEEYKNDKVHFLVATKDDGFRYLAELVKKYNHVMHFARGIQDLKEYIE